MIQPTFHIRRLSTLNTKPELLHSNSKTNYYKSPHIGTLHWKTKPTFNLRATALHQRRLSYHANTKPSTYNCRRASQDHNYPSAMPASAMMHNRLVFNEVRKIEKVNTIKLNEEKIQMNRLMTAVRLSELINERRVLTAQPKTALKCNTQTLNGSHQKLKLVSTDISNIENNADVDCSTEEILNLFKVMP